MAGKQWSDFHFGWYTANLNRVGRWREPDGKCGVPLLYYPVATTHHCLAHCAFLRICGKNRPQKYNRYIIVQATRNKQWMNVKRNLFVYFAILVLFFTPFLAGAITVEITATVPGCGDGLWESASSARGRILVEHPVHRSDSPAGRSPAPLYAHLIPLLAPLVHLAAAVEEEVGAEGGAGASSPRYPRPT